MNRTRAHQIEVASRHRESLDTKIAKQYRVEALLPYSQLPDITRPTWNPDPLVVAELLDNNGPLLVALGLAHRSDLGNSHHMMLAQVAASFIAFTDHLGTDYKRVIINEGGVWPRSESLDLAYEEGCEPQWLQNFGIRMGVEVVSPELSNEGVDLLLTEGFTPAEIACYYFVRQVPQWQRSTRRPDFATYIQGKMDYYRPLLNFDFSLPNLVTLYEDTYHKTFDRTNTRFFLEQSAGYMLTPTSRVQQVSIACNMGRDINLLHTIEQYSKENVSTLTGFGWTHIRALQSRLERMDTPAF